MASIDRTAYPQFKCNHVVRELVALYSINEPEVAFILKHARQPARRLTLAILLKSFQRLRYFPALDEVPAGVLRHIRGNLKFRIQVKPAQPSTVTLYRYHSLIRQYLGFHAFEEGGLDVAARAMRDAAAVMDHPPDLINVAIEQLVTANIALPAFSTLDRLARRVRTLVNSRFFAQIAQRLTAEEKARLDGLLQTGSKAGKSPLQEVKRLPKRSSLKHFQELIDHMAQLL